MGEETCQGRTACKGKSHLGFRNEQKGDLNIDFTEHFLFLIGFICLKFLVKMISAVAGVWPSWVERLPIHQKFAGLISSQGTRLGCWFDPQSGCIWEATS